MPHSKANTAVEQFVCLFFAFGVSIYLFNSTNFQANEYIFRAMASQTTNDSSPDFQFDSIDFSLKEDIDAAAETVATFKHYEIPSRRSMMFVCQKRIHCNFCFLGVISLK